MAETPSSTACQANALCRKLDSTVRRCDQGGNIQRPLASNSGQVWTKVGGFIFIGFIGLVEGKMFTGNAGNPLYQSICCGKPLRKNFFQMFLSKYSDL